MAEDIKNVNVEEEEEDIITLEFDDDTAVDCYVLGTFELNDKEYIALEPEDGTDDVYIYGYKQISDDEFEITEIESEEEFDAAAAEFDAIMAEICSRQALADSVYYVACRGYAILVRMWRNWQTRTVQVRVSNIVKVRILSSAPKWAALRAA